MGVDLDLLFCVPIMPMEAIKSRLGIIDDVVVEVRRYEKINVTRRKLLWKAMSEIEVATQSIMLTDLQDQIVQGIPSKLFVKKFAKAFKEHEQLEIIEHIKALPVSGYIFLDWW